MKTAIYVGLTDQEFEALRRAARHSYRPPRAEAAYLLSLALRRRERSRGTTSPDSRPSAETKR